MTQFKYINPTKRKLQTSHESGRYMLISQKLHFKRARNGLRKSVWGEHCNTSWRFSSERFS